MKDVSKKILMHKEQVVNFRHSSLTVLAATLLCSNSNLGHAKTSYKEAVLKENTNPIVRETVLEGRLEGYALLSYIIDEQGQVSDIEPFISSTIKDPYKNAELFYSNLRYSPAQTAEKTIKSASITFFEDSIAFLGDNNNNVRKGFLNHYSRLQKLIAGRALNDAEIALETLHDEFTKNTNEQALYHYLASQFWQIKQDWTRYEFHVTHAFTLRDKLPLEYRQFATQNMLQWYMYAQQFSDAKEVAQAFAHLNGVNVKPETVSKAVDEVVAVAAQQLNINQQIEFQYLTTRVLNPIRSDINLKLLQGPLERMQLRCTFHVESFDVNSLENQNNVSLTIKPEFGPCHLLLKGNTSTILNVAQTGKLLI